MNTRQLHTFVLRFLGVCLITGMLSGAPLLAGDKPKFEAKNADKALIAQLREGGFVLYMRHGPTDTSKPDRVPDVDLNDCSTQRPLTDEGRIISTEVGNAIRKAGIPIGEVIASPMCRTKQTAWAAFGPVFTIDLNLMYSSNFTSEQKKATTQTTRELISRAVKPGTNRVLVAHAPNLMDINGYFVNPEATVVIFRALGDKGFEYLASVTPTQWPELLE